jgi:hypothetical protein
MTYNELLLNRLHTVTFHRVAYYCTDKEWFVNLVSRLWPLIPRAGRGAPTAPGRAPVPRTRCPVVRFSGALECRNELARLVVEIADRKGRSVLIESTEMRDCS